MSKPLLNSVFKVISKLNAVYDVRCSGCETYSDGWQQGRRALAEEIMKELGVID